MVTTEPIDKMTSRQIAAKYRQHFPKRNHMDHNYDKCFVGGVMTHSDDTALSHTASPGGRCLKEGFFPISQTSLANLINLRSNFFIPPMTNHAALTLVSVADNPSKCCSQLHIPLFTIAHKVIESRQCMKGLRSRR
jgi:hypothetical protein